MKITLTDDQLLGLRLVYMMPRSKASTEDLRRLAAESGYTLEQLHGKAYRLGLSRHKNHIDPTAARLMNNAVNANWVANALNPQMGSMQGLGASHTTVAETDGLACLYATDLHCLREGIERAQKYERGPWWHRLANWIRKVAA